MPQPDTNATGPSAQSLAGRNKPTGPGAAREVDLSWMVARLRKVHTYLTSKQEEAERSQCALPPELHTADTLRCQIQVNVEEIVTYRDTVGRAIGILRGLSKETL